MSSAAEGRSFPYTNDVGTEYENPEKPPLEEEAPRPPPMDGPSTTAAAISPLSVNTLQ
jgi:hypothetical protein